MLSGLQWGCARRGGPACARLVQGRALASGDANARSVVTSLDSVMLVRDRQSRGGVPGLCAFAAVLSIGGNRRGAALYLTVACATTAAWSAAVAIASLMGATRTLPELVLEMLRSATWIAFLYQLLGESVKQHGARCPRRARARPSAFILSVIVADIAGSLVESPLVDSYTIVWTPDRSDHWLDADREPARTTGQARSGGRASCSSARRLSPMI